MKNKYFRLQLLHVTPLSCYEEVQSDRSIDLIVIDLFYFVCCASQLRWEAQQTEPRHSGTQAT
jgi:hypothetical protein